uniref:Uncharacterized protein n=1 Tax=Oryza rufipogon TaxID=4529 RepID=A0A0E0P680_ORYRU
MTAPWWLTAVASEWWLMAIEAKTLLRASLPDVGQHLNQCSLEPRATIGGCSTPATLTEQASKEISLLHLPSRNDAIDVGAFMGVNSLLLNEQMWDTRSKWKTPQSKFATFET